MVKVYSYVRLAWKPAMVVEVRLRAEPERQEKTDFFCTTHLRIEAGSS